MVFAYQSLFVEVEWIADGCQLLCRQLPVNRTRCDRWERVE